MTMKMMLIVTIMIAWQTKYYWLAYQYVRSQDQ